MAALNEPRRARAGAWRGKSRQRGGQPGGSTSYGPDGAGASTALVSMNSSRGLPSSGVPVLRSPPSCATSLLRGAPALRGA